MTKKSIENSPIDGDRRRVVMSLSSWMDDEFDAAIERSFDQESMRLSLEDAERCSGSLHEHALDPDAIREVLFQLVNTDALKEAAKPDYVSTTAEVLSDRLRFTVGLRFETIEGGSIAGSIPLASASKLHAISASKKRHSDFRLESGSWNLALTVKKRFES